MINNKYISLVVLSSLILAMPAFAKTSVNNRPLAELNNNRGEIMGRGMMLGRTGVVGTVTAVNGTTLTVTSINKVVRAEDGNDGRTPTPTPTPIVYTIDASNASVIKTGAVSTVSAIAVGDMVRIQGTITGTNVVATTIRDGLAKTSKPEPTPLIQGNGQPIIAGAITVINGTTLTITNKSNVTYTVDASTAKIQNKGVLSTLSTVAVGDNVIVQGAVNGTSVTAYSVIDQGTTPSPSALPNNKGEDHGNFFGGIGRFFQHLFGF